MKTASQYMDPDQAIVPLVGLAEEYVDLSSKPHSHQRGQLYYCIAGTIKVHVKSGIWLVSPYRAVWIPRRVVHHSSSKRAVSLRMLYFDCEEFSSLPADVCVLQISMLLRELIEAAIKQGQSWGASGPEARLANVIVDRILLCPKEALYLPLPNDNRALAVCDLMRESPQLHMDIEKMCDEVGISQRTFVRLLKKETDLNLQQWKHQLILLSAIEMIANGSAITTVAMDLGYATSSAFTYMFRKTIGVCPSEYLNIE